MKINKVFCLFEQSGTFKNEFRKLGIQAEDYDILNDFGETDHQVDLFAEIDRAYEGKPSLFDEIGEMDLVFAFFPCTRFQAYNCANFQSTRHGNENFNDVEKLEYSMKLHKQLHRLYMLICKLFVISNRGGWRLIVENPYTQPHYLTSFFPIKPALIDNDRRQNGDYYKKPTQFWFVNCQPEQNMFLESLEHVETHTVVNAAKLKKGKNQQVNRSLMHPQYARRFIKAYVMDGE